jgi:cytochrome c553
MRWVAIVLLATTAACGSEDRSEPEAEAPPVAFDGALVTEDSAKIAHGRRLVDVLGCTGCHGASLQGERFYELYASNLTRELPKYSDAQFERLMRAGEHPTGREVWGMPSEIFQHLSEPDLAALLSYLRSLPPAGLPTQPRLPWEPEAEKMIAAGELKPAADFVRTEKKLAPADLGPSHVLGRYITRVTCAECHAAELKGREGDTPNLDMAGAYSDEQFRTLMRTGKPPSGKELRLMSAVARDRFSKMTDHEVEALYGYLQARAKTP